MENIKEYIESGILELYVLGDVTPQERLQVEEYASKYPEIKAELDEIEKSLALFTRENAIEPSEALSNRVLNSLVTNLGDDRIFSPATDNVTPFVKPSATPSSSFYKYAFAACLGLLIISLCALISLYGKLQQSNTQIATLQTQKQQFANRVNLVEGELSVFHDPSFKLLKLQGTHKTPASVLTVAWSPVKKKVMIDMATAKMPENDKDHQYQLWAMVKGKPVDLGVFDANADSTDMKEMKPVASAEAFAVTLEPKGGSSTPTMDQMMVIGKF